MKSGYLTKSPPEGRAAIAQWHRRWFVFSDSLLVYPLAKRYVRMEYYQSEEDAKRLKDPKGRRYVNIRYSLLCRATRDYTLSCYVRRQALVWTLVISSSVNIAPAICVVCGESGSSTSVCLVIFTCIAGLDEACRSGISIEICQAVCGVVQGGSQIISASSDPFTPYLPQPSSPTKYFQYGL